RPRDELELHFLVRVAPAVELRAQPSTKALLRLRRHTRQASARQPPAASPARGKNGGTPGSPVGPLLDCVLVAPLLAEPAAASGCSQGKAKLTRLRASWLRGAKPRSAGGRLCR